MRNLCSPTVREGIVDSGGPADVAVTWRGGQKQTWRRESKEKCWVSVCERSAGLQPPPQPLGVPGRSGRPTRSLASRFSCGKTEKRQLLTASFRWLVWSACFHINRCPRAVWANVTSSVRCFRPLTRLCLFLCYRRGQFVQAPPQDRWEEGGEEEEETHHRQVKQVVGVAWGLSFILLFVIKDGNNKRFEGLKLRVLGVNWPFK